MGYLVFGILVLLPSVGLCYLSLATFYGWVRAYLAISWVPMTLFLIIYFFLHEGVVPSAQRPEVELLFEAVVWTSLIQGLIGVILVIRAFIKKEDWVVPAIASLWTVLPFFLLK